MKTYHTLYSTLYLSPREGRRQKLLQAYRYKDEDNIVHEVPKGYVTNGADVPRWAWSYQPPNDTDILPAVVFHDYYCRNKQYELADALFKEILEKLPISKSRRATLYYSVRGYSKYARPLIKRIKKRFKKKKDIKTCAKEAKTALHKK